MKHWPIKMLGEIATVIRGVSFDKSQACDLPGRNSIPILRAGNIQDSLLTDSDLIYVPSELVSNEQRMKIGDLAICMSSGSSAIVGKTARLSTNWVGSVGAFCAIIRFNSKINHRFGSYWFRSSAFIQWRDSNAKGANIQNIRRTELERLTLPVPPLAEQERIVKILDEADELRKLRAQADRRTADLIPALFHEMFGDISCPKKNSSVFTIRDLLENKSIIDVQDGNHGEIHPKASEYTTVGIPFIFAKHISKNRFDISACPFLTRERSRKLRIGFSKPNDVLLSHKGSIGFTAIVPSDFEFIILSPQVTYYRFDTQKINPFFAWGYFQTSSFQNLLECLSQQATRAYIGITRQKELPFLVPPLSLQQEFAQRVAEIREMEADQAKSKSRLDALFHSLLHRAFEGEL